MTQLRTGLRWGVGMLAAVGLLGTAEGAWGQTLSDLSMSGRGRGRSLTDAPHVRDGEPDGSRDRRVGV
jgi:hypothetical protein